MREVVGAGVAAAWACLILGSAWLWYTARPSWAPKEATWVVDFRRMEEWRKNVGTHKLKVVGNTITGADGRLLGKFSALTPDDLWVRSNDADTMP